MTTKRKKSRKSLGSAGAAKKGTSSRKFNFKSYGKEALTTAGNIGLGLVGIAVGNQVLKAHKKDTAVVHGITLGASIATIPLAKKGWLKALIGGVGIFSALKLLNKASAEVVQTQGLSGLPDSVKSSIRNFFPSLGEVSEDGSDNLSSIEQEMMGLASSDPELFGRIRAAAAGRKMTDNAPASRPAPYRPGAAVSMSNIKNLAGLI